MLVLDDDPATLSFVRSALHPRVELIPHTAPHRALHTLRTSVVDALVLDLILTGSNGLDLLRQLSEHTRPPRIVVLTGWHAGAEQALTLGATTTLAKPCTAEDLRAAVLDTEPNSDSQPDALHTKHDTTRNTMSICRQYQPDESRANHPSIRALRNLRH